MYCNMDGYCKATAATDNKYTQTNVSCQVPVMVSRFYKGKGNPNRRGFNNSFHLELLTDEGLADTIQAGNATAPVHRKDGRTHRKSANFISSQLMALDFDNLPPGTTLDDLLTMYPVVGAYAVHVHTTASHTVHRPRMRAWFILDRPITNAKTMTRLNRALVRACPGADPKCVDPCRFYFGSLNCAMLRRYGLRLPVAKLEEVAMRQAQAVKHAPTTTGVSVDELLDTAIKDSVNGRNDAGFNLARGLRAIGLSYGDASTHILTYQAVVENAKDHPYTLNESLATLDSVYNWDGVCRVSARYVDGEISIPMSDALNAFGNALNSGALSIAKRDAIKFSVILNIFKETNKAEIDMSCRDLAERLGYSHKAAADLLNRLVKAGVLVKSSKSDHQRSNTYSLGSMTRLGVTTLPKSLHTIMTTPSVSSEKSDKSNAVVEGESHKDSDCMYSFGEYHSLIDHPASQYGAKVEPKLIPVTYSEQEKKALSEVKLGPAALNIICKLLDAEHNRLPMSALGKNSQAVVRSLATIKAVTVENFHRSRLVQLTDDWYESLERVKVMLNTFGVSALRKAKHARQQAEYHGKRAELSNGDRRSEAEDFASRASGKLDDANAQAYLDMLARQDYADKHGVPVVVPTLRKRQSKQQKQESHVNGRNLSPANAVEKPNAIHNSDYLQPGQDDSYAWSLDDLRKRLHQTERQSER